WWVSIGFEFRMIEAAFARIGRAEMYSFIVPSHFLTPLRLHAFGFTRILGSTERPGTISCSYPRMLARSKRILTGTRCTIFVKFPVALSGGSRANTAPVPDWKLSTLPVNL